MKRTLTGTLEFEDGSVHLILSEPTQRAVAAEIAARQEAARVAAEVNHDRLARTYHLGAEPTPGRGYDDRLKMRLGCGADAARELVTSGRITHQYLGNRYSVCEQAVRDFYALLPAGSKLHAKQAADPPVISKAA
jgi:hypothetical protein